MSKGAARKGIPFGACFMGQFWGTVSFARLVRMEWLRMKVGYVRISTREQNTARQDELMKVKDMILKESLEEKRAETAKVIEAFSAAQEQT